MSTGGKDDDSGAGPQLEYGEKALGLQKQIYEDALKRSQPFYEAGTGALSNLTQRLGIGGDTSASNYGSLLKSFGMSDYQADPGYQFRLSEGNKGLERALASKGQFASMNPAAAKALTGYGQEMASQEYGNAYNRYNADQSNIFNRLAAITGTGQTASNAMNATGSNYGNAASDLYTGMGNAIVSANQARAANRGSMFNSLLGLGGQLGAAYLTGGASTAFSPMMIG